MSDRLPSSLTQNSGPTVINQKGLFNRTDTHGNRNENNNKKKDSLLSKYWWSLLIPTTVLVLGSFIAYYMGWINSGEVESVHIEPSPKPTLPSIPTNICENTDFSEQLWDTSHYQKSGDDYYLPTEKSRRLFLYPPMKYKDKTSALFKKIHIEYVATFQDESSTTSASLYVALQDSNRKKIFEINLPEPNRQLVYLKTEISPESPPQTRPTSIPPINLPTQISFGGTHEISIGTIKGESNAVIYVINGRYINQNNNQVAYYGEIRTNLATVDPSIAENTLMVGTGRYGKLKIKKFSVCDK